LSHLHTATCAPKRCTDFSIFEPSEFWNRSSAAYKGHHGNDSTFDPDRDDTRIDPAVRREPELVTAKPE